MPRLQAGLGELALLAPSAPITVLLNRVDSVSRKRWARGKPTRPIGRVRSTCVTVVSVGAVMEIRSPHSGLLIEQVVRAAALAGAARGVRRAFGRVVEAVEGLLDRLVAGLEHVAVGLAEK